MKLNRITKIGVALAATSLIVTGCRSDSGGGEGDGDGAASSKGITSEPCPNAVNEENGCIYLGIISDLTVGPFAPLAVPITEAQAAFWQRVNENGGIDGYDVDATKYVRDAEYNPELHNQMYQEIRDEILALAQTLGSSQTLAILEDMKTDNVVGVPASWNSAWEFQDIILESGASYCFESMNAVDWAVANRGDIKKVLSVGFPSDYGGDSAVGVEAAAKANGLEYKKIETPPGQDNQAGAIAAILREQPELVIVTTGPAEMATIVGGAAAQGYKGTFVGNSPTWNPALLKSPAAPALKAMYFQAAPWGPWGTDTPGHEAMREALGDVTPNDGYTAGWVWSYPLLAAMKKAAEDGDLNRESLVEAAGSLEEIDYEGMLPEGAGTTAGEPAEVADRSSVIAKVDEAAPTGVSITQDFFVGPTAEDYEFSKPCFSLQ